MNKNVEIVIDGIEYILDVDKSIRDGVLIKKHVTISDIEVGDVFCDPRGLRSLVVRTHYHKWFLTGYDGLYPVWENGNGVTKIELINYLNETKQVFTRNINSEVDDILNGISIK